MLLDKFTGLEIELGHKWNKLNLIFQIIIGTIAYFISKSLLIDDMSLFSKSKQIRKKSKLFRTWF